ncbi:hypothetical protein [Microlunatus sp. Y2014]|uniref:hypothetical protein n=1 Tax=Microlunatus sp. Y2014 TaxID=3418488 RepID=UPI003DA77E9F
MSHALPRGGSILLALGLVVALLGVPVESARAVDPTGPAAQAVVDADPNVTYLGEPVHVSQPSPNMIGTMDGRAVSYQVFKGTGNSDNPGAFTAIDVETGEVVINLPMPTAETARELTVASDGRVYVATYFDQKLWQFDPETKQLRDLGTYEPDPSDAQPFGACNGPDGQVFIPTYKHSALYKYDPATDQITKVATINPDNIYLHACAWDPKTNDLYVTAGGQTAELWRLADAGAGEKTKITNETNVPGLEAETFIKRLWLVNDHLVASAGGQRQLVIGTDGVVDKWTPAGEIGGYNIVRLPDEPTKFWYTKSSSIFEYDTEAMTTTDTGLDIGYYFGDATFAANGDLIGTDARGPFRLTMAGEYTSTPWTFSQPTAIQKMLQGPNGLMFASGYPTGLARVDATGGGQLHPSLSSGQYESSIIRDGLMYVGHYGNARFSRYDPNNPTAAPRRLFDGLAEGQDRPFAMAYDPERDEVYMGTIAGYGKLQGGLAVYEFATGKHTWYTDEIVQGQSIISVVHNPNDGLVYIGTNIDGGMGIEAPDGEAKLIVWDPATRTVVREIVPVADREGVTGLLVAPDGKVWGWAEDTLFAYDTTTNEVVHSEGGLAPRYAANTFYWAWAYQYVSKVDGNVYATVGSQLLRIDPDTLAVTVLVPSGAAFGNIDTAGDIYFSSKSHAYKYTVPQPVPNAAPTRETKCLVVNAALAGRGLAYPEGYRTAWRQAVEHLEQQVANGRGERLRSVYCD